MNLKDIKALIEMLKDTDVTEIEIEKDDMKIRIKRESPTKTEHQPQMVQVAPLTVTPHVQSVVKTPAADITQKQTEEKGKQLKTVTAPMVGTFYRAPSPDAPPYVEEGSVVKKGQVLCIIEAMKLMNEIESEYNGKIVSILAENGKPVEFGEPIFVIEVADQE